MDCVLLCTDPYSLLQSAVLIYISYTITVKPKSTAAGSCVKTVSLLCRAVSASVPPKSTAIQERNRRGRAAIPF